MGMHFGLIVARTSVQQLRAAFTLAWPQFEVVASTDHLPNSDAMWAWKKSQAKFVSAAKWSKENPGREVYLFWQDGPWAVMLDESYTLAAEEEGLLSLSQHLGCVASFVMESAGGCAFFWCYEKGQLRRKIINSDGEMSLEGQPLPEEAGIDVNRYYMAETEALWNAFGLAPLQQMPASSNCQAICVEDHTDYSH